MRKDWPENLADLGAGGGSVGLKDSGSGVRCHVRHCWICHPPPFDIGSTLGKLFNVSKHMFLY